MKHELPKVNPDKVKKLSEGTLKTAKPLKESEYHTNKFLTDDVDLPRTIIYLILSTITVLIIFLGTYWGINHIDYIYNKSDICKQYIKEK